MNVASKLLAAVAGAAAIAGTLGVIATSGAGAQPRRTSVSHVLLISVDGLHQSDLAWYAAEHPDSTLAHLARGGAQYTMAATPVPSDSFPGMVGIATGGNPGTTGVYYDDTFNHDVYPAGTTNCTTATQGAEVTYFEALDLNFNTGLTIDAGQGLSGLPDSILQMTGNPTTLINPAALPVDDHSCKPIYPNQYLKVNTIFDVIHNHGMLTAWSDKHPAYQILNGPQGNGITDLFTPEINAPALMPGGTPWPGGIDYTGDNLATQQYDSYKVQAVLNELDGFNHQRTKRVGVPAILGMNFQTVSTAEKLYISSSTGLGGGYLPGTNTPGPLLSGALDYINAQLTRMVQELRNGGLLESTAIVLTAKHGQSPLDPNQLVRVDDGPIMNAVNADWQASHPGSGPIILGGTDDDALMWWLTNRSQSAADWVARFLMRHTFPGVTYAQTGTSNTTPVEHSGLVKIYAGAAAARFFHVPLNDPRHPDILGVVRVGVVYTHGKKIAEHGGANPGDRHVPLVVYAPGVVAAGMRDAPVETTQVAPTVLKLLGLNPMDLQAVQIEHTQVLPGIG